MRVLRRYVFAVLAVALATGLQRELWSFLPPSPQLFFFPAVVVVAWKEGRGPGLFAVLLSAASMAFYFLDPPQSFHVAAPEDIVDLVLFSSMAAALVVLVARTRSLERRARLIFDEVPVGIVWTLGPRGERSEANAYARKLLGESEPSGALPWSRGGRPLRSADGTLLAPAERPHARALRGERVSAELELELGDGRRVPILESAAPLRDESGQIEGALVAFQDISALKEVELLRRQWNTLVAHDLRAPLHVILMTAGLLRAERPSAALDRLERAAMRLDRIVRDLLDASRLDVGQLPLVKSDVDLVELVRECVLEHEDIEVDLRVRGEVPPISADRERLFQILDNLLTNAAKYRSRGTVVGVEIGRRDDVVELSVKNRGPGLTESDRANLFQRFRRLGDRRQPGIGVGLYIAKGLVEAHDGTISCESVPHAETTFRVRLPAPMRSA